MQRRKSSGHACHNDTKHRAKSSFLILTVMVGRMAMVSREIVAGRDWELTMAVGMSSCTGGLVVIGPPVIRAP